MDLNKTQIQILTKFIVADSLHYADAMPEGVDNDSYKYHLKFLVEKGYLQKDDKEYSLTEQGRIFCHRITPSGERQEEFFVCVMDVVYKMIDGIQHVLMQRRTKHPYIGAISLVTGKVKAGEPIVNAANRKLQEETGLSGVFEIVGLLRQISYNPEGLLVQDQWYNVCVASSFSGELASETVWGKNAWMPVTEAFHIAGSGDVLTCLADGKKGFTLEKIIHDKVV